MNEKLVNIEANISKAFGILNREEDYDSEKYSTKGEAATAIFQNVLILDPNNYDALVGLGKCLSFYPRKYVEALALYERAIAIKPEKPNAHYGMGLILFHGSEREIWEDINNGYRKAIRKFMDAIEKGDQRESLISEVIGKTYYRLGEYREAIEWFERAIEKMQPDDLLLSASFLGGNACEAIGDNIKAIRFYKLGREWPLPGHDDVENRIKELENKL